MYDTSVNQSYESLPGQFKDELLPVRTGINLVGFFIGDCKMKRIPLTQGKFSIIDDEDYNELNKYKWFAQNTGNSWRAGRNTARDKNGKQKRIFMSRFIMNCPKGLQVDHLNHNTLDNRRLNLRVCTLQENHWNEKKRRYCKSQYKGIYKGAGRKKWQAAIKINGKRIILGYFYDEIEAAMAYDRNAEELFGEFACINFPKKGQECQRPSKLLM